MNDQNIALVTAFTLLIAGVCAGLFIYSRHSSYRSLDHVENLVPSSSRRASSDTQQKSLQTLAVPTAGNRFSVATTSAQFVQTQDWMTFADFKQFKIQFNYPRLPVVLAQHAITSNAGYLQIAFPDRFIVTMDASPMDQTLDQWLYEPPQPDDHSNYQSFVQEIQSNPGMYIASTTIDDTPSIELGFDCSKVDPSSGIPRFSQLTGWEYGYYIEAITVRHGIFYRFTGRDVCGSRQGIGFYRKILSSIQFAD